ncbi:polysaccharide deacetylase family protein [Natronolimnohabitans sp. A-GB9]|uniref:polysaccharide deacetylase family protein n=1 Tax=Natronolimnohabitans sp. A-GB9 TaxID=3069757 RepID=UPI0027ADBDB3|nr:polysaccharide deacetylase family protein [Natronolimnohabitans sp. A-GB9]MDQ2052595.1 polysaccharide deacetylase family protein [Natronolimnohabitans sp. A-GB9]
MTNETGHRTESPSQSRGDETINESTATGDPRYSEFPRDRSPLPGDSTFALCLTHDVDRPYKGLRALYYATQGRPGYHLRTVFSSANPYWQFEEIMALEDELGVRSAFYFLNEQHLLAERPVRDWVSPANWVQHLGRYDITAPEIVDAVRDLDDGGWEVGLHGSYHTADDRTRLREEKTTLEDVLERPVVGCRQHHLNLSVPETWRHHRAIGLEYDTSLGSGTECGFHAGYRPVRPFDDEFLVFPLTIMEQALPNPGTRLEDARETCDRLLMEAAKNDAVMTVLWHPRYFNEREFPGYRTLYRELVERALELGAWVGPPRELYTELQRTDDVERPDTRVRL